MYVWVSARASVPCQMRINGKFITHSVFIRVSEHQFPPAPAASSQKKLLRPVRARRSTTCQQQNHDGHINNSLCDSCTSEIGPLPKCVFAIGITRAARSGGSYSFRFTSRAGKSSYVRATLFDSIKTTSFATFSNITGVAFESDRDPAIHHIHHAPFRCSGSGHD